MALEYMLSVSARLGLEGVCADELRRLGFDGVQAENGRVLCLSDNPGIARANLNLRTGERVLLRLGRFDAPDFDALLSLVGTMAGVYFSNRKTSALIAYRLEQLEEKVNKHNQVVERTYRLEDNDKLMEEKIKVANHRIEDLERKVG